MEAVQNVSLGRHRHTTSNAVKSYCREANVSTTRVHRILHSGYLTLLHDMNIRGPVRRTQFC